MIKNIRGGKREGAGRKALGKDKRISRSITIKKELLDEIKIKNSKTPSSCRYLFDE